MYIHIYCCSTLDQYKCICMSEWESLRECECELCLAPLPWILEILDGHIYYQNWNAMGAHAQHLSSPCPPSPWPSARASAQPRPAHSVVLFYLPNPAQPMGWSGHHGLPIWAHGLQCSTLYPLERSIIRTSVKKQVPAEKTFHSIIEKLLSIFEETFTSLFSRQKLKGMQFILENTLRMVTVLLKASTWDIF